MKKKIKLLLSIASMSFAIALFCFGIYAAISVNYTISGSVAYEVQDVFVNIETSLYVSTQSNLTSQGTLNSNVATFEGGQVASGTEKVTTYTDSFATYNPSTEEITNAGTTLSKTSPNIPINYGPYEANTKGYAYYIVVAITNYGTEGVNVVVTDNINSTAINSLTSVSESTTISEKEGENNYSTKYIVIGLALDDATHNIDNQSFDVSILIERDVELEPTLDKLSFTLNGNEYEVSCKDNSITGTVVIPSTYNGLPVTSIGSFGSCNLTKLVIPDSVNEIDNYAFGGNIAMVKYHKESSFYTFDDGTLTIGSTENSSYSVDLYTEWFPEPGTSYPAWFALNPLVDKVIILNTVTGLGDYYFEYCGKLKSVTVPDSVKSLKTYVFYGCSSLQSIKFESTIPPTIYNTSIMTNCKIYVPASSVNAYKTANIWSNFADRIEGI